MKSTHLYQLIMLLFIAVGSSGLFLPAGVIQSDKLDLSKTDTVRVLLFDSNPPERILAKPLEAPATVLYDESELALEKGDQLEITVLDGKLFIRAEDINFTTSSIHFKNHGSLLQLITDSFGYRSYRGEMQIEPGVRSGIRVINHVALEDYIASVIGSEMNFTTFEALKTQAVVSRTYALWSIHNSPFSDFDLKDFEANQVYVGAIPSKPWYLDAAMATHGEILTWSDMLILSVFSSTCGGHTSNNEDVWSGNPQPYLRAVSDHEMCSISPHYEWKFEVNRSEISELLKNRYGFVYNSVKPVKDEGGRVTKLTFLNRNGNELAFSGNEFRLLVNRNYSPLSIRSTRFNWEEDGKSITITGNGLGHGVGLCQWGAKGFAQNGWNYKEILAFYFSGTNVVNFHNIESQKIALHK